MENKKLYHKKQKAQLDEWIANIEAFKAKSKKISVDLQMQLNEHISIIERKTEDASEKLSVLKNASEDAWGSIKEGIDAAWGSIKSSFEDAKVKFN